MGRALLSSCGVILTTKTQRTQRFFATEYTVGAEINCLVCLGTIYQFTNVKLQRRC